MIDGGKGQLSSAVEVLQELGLHQQAVTGLAKRLEEVFVPGEGLPMNIPKTSPALKMLQRIRDEAHRFAITYHRERRQKNTLQTELEEIEGVGPKRATILLTTFGSVREIEKAAIEQLAEHVGWSTARHVYRYFHERDGENNETANPRTDTTDARSDSKSAEGE